MPSAHKGPALLKRSAYHPFSQHAEGLQTLERVIHEREADTPHGMFSIRKKEPTGEVGVPFRGKLCSKLKRPYVTSPPCGELWAVEPGSRLFFLREPGLVLSYSDRLKNNPDLALWDGSEWCHSCKSLQSSSPKMIEMRFAWPDWTYRLKFKQSWEMYMITAPISASWEQNILSFATKLVRFWTLEGLVDSKEEPRTTVPEQFVYNRMQKYISEYKYFSPKCQKQFHPYITRISN